MKIIPSIGRWLLPITCAAAATVAAAQEIKFGYNGDLSASPA
jgi:hypothetical protein